jgi:hypothetical protein
MTPGHHLLLHLKSPCIRCPAGPGAPFPKFMNYCRNAKPAAPGTERKQTLAGLSNPK